MNYAIIDLGSNTIRLSIYRYEDGNITAVLKQKEVAGLAAYMRKGRLEPDGIQKACDILREFREIAARFVAEGEIHVFATASLRGILNQEQAVETIQENTGLCLEVLPGEEEARLDFVGASHYMQCQDGVLIDIGGASTELVRFQDGKPAELVCMPIGCLNLYTRFVGKVMPTKKERKNIKKEIQTQFKEAVHWKNTEKLPLLIGVGGTARAAHSLSLDLFSLPKDQYEIKAGHVREILNMLKNDENEIYRTIYKQIPERTLTIFTGLMILSAAIKRFDCDSLFVSYYGVREGYLIDRVLREDITNAGNHGARDCECGAVHAEQGTVMA